MFPEKYETLTNVIITNEPRKKFLCFMQITVKIYIYIFFTVSTELWLCWFLTSDKARSIVYILCTISRSKIFYHTYKDNVSVPLISV